MRKSQHGVIVRDLALRIVSGAILPGARLPAEPDLCEHYGVSRPVLREATRVLVAKGLVVSKQRAGAIVRPRSDWHILDPDVLGWLVATRPEEEFIQTLLEVRLIFEPAIAAKAAKAAKPEDLKRIRQAYERMAAAESPADLLEPDVAFHRRIAEATHNPLLAYIGNMLSLALHESIKLSSQLPNTHELSLPRHKAVLTALEARDPLAARQASLVLLTETSEDLAKVLHRSVDELQPSV